MNENFLHQIAEDTFNKHGLTEWTFAIVDEHPTIEQCAGFTHQETKRVEVYRELWPTLERNAVEVTRHELAHAVLGHGRHDEQWWCALTKLGGDGAWIGNDGKPEGWSWTREKVMTN